MNAIINVSYCNHHYKGGDFLAWGDGAEHAEWLEQCVRHLALSSPLPVMVSMTGFLGWPEVPAGRERDALWRANKMARFVTMAANPGHQVGASWCIRLGLEAAGKLGYDCLVHTAEDVVPHKGVIEQMLHDLEEGAEYAGARWGIHQDEANAQFFACRVPYLAGIWDPTAIPRHDHIERYLMDLLEGKKICWTGTWYRHTHDFSQWRQWAEEVKR